MSSSTVDTSSFPTESLQVESIPDTTNEELSGVQSFKDSVPDTGYLPLQDFMGITSPDDAQKDKLQYIWESFAKGRDRAETLEAIKDAKLRMSAPDIGENYLHKLYSYTRLIEDGRSIEREKKVYES